MKLDNSVSFWTMENEPVETLYGFDGEKDGLETLYFRFLGCNIVEIVWKYFFISPDNADLSCNSTSWIFSWNKIEI